MPSRENSFKECQKCDDGNTAEHHCKSCDTLLCEACAREHKRDPKTKVHIVQSLSKVADPEQERMASYFQDLVQESDSLFDPSRFAAPINYLHYSFALRQLAARSEGDQSSTTKWVNPLSLTPAEPGSLELSLYDPAIFKEKLIHQMHDLHLNPKDNEGWSERPPIELKATMLLCSQDNDEKDPVGGDVTLEEKVNHQPLGVFSVRLDCLPVSGPAGTGKDGLHMVALSSQDGTLLTSEIDMPDKFAGLKKTPSFTPVASSALLSRFPNGVPFVKRDMQVV